MRKNLIYAVMTALLVLSGSEALAASIINTKHNLSISGPGPIKSTVESRICIFCHTPHKANLDIPYLWNRQLSTANYTTYSSSTLYATVGQPTGASKLCLSCHDGTIALGALISETQEIVFQGGLRFIPPGPTKLGTDLSDDHPVSFIYNASLATQRGELVNPTLLPSNVKLDKDEMLQCTTCHDPHDNTNSKFLVMPNINSNLCTTCHDKNGWVFSLHSQSTAQWNGSGTDPWPHTSYQTVAENACENCHKPHTAESHAMLLNFVYEEDNCLVCHNGNVAAKNIEAELTKPYKHPVQNYTGVHDAGEDFTSGQVPAHVECQDCHNPHQANDAASPGPPAVSGRNKGVKGIDSGGQQIPEAQNLYEICFKCHADNNMITQLSITRQIEQLNTRMEFDINNPSFHPVEARGVNNDVPSLRSPYTTQSIIFCTDCHNNDSNSGPAGPHGSNNRYLLAENYETADFTRERYSSYALCYKCHDRNSILNDRSFEKHREHISGAKASCSICHDPHGISHLQGNSTNNRHLINFNTTIVEPDSQGRLRFEDLGRFKGRCYLKCHNKKHEPKEYGN